MHSKKYLVIFVFILAVVFVSSFALAQEVVVGSTELAPAASSPETLGQSENTPQWVWGEVLGLDAQAKTITLKYLDYENDQEKEIILTVDEKTTFENVKSFEEIKLQDTLSIDYLPGLDGKNIVKNINSENPNAVSPEVVNQPIADEVKAAPVTEAPVVNVQETPQVNAPIIETPVPAAAEPAVPVALEAPVPEAAVVKVVDPLPETLPTDGVSQTVPAPIQEPTQ